MESRLREGKTEGRQPKQVATATAEVRHGGGSEQVEAGEVVRNWILNVF